ncbi:MAG TPA: FkbM family methyltransferase [Stellaceae bacterium]|nr:FkbM family methyltransferase [Stellaceae bacterium]
MRGLLDKIGAAKELATQAKHALRPFEPYLPKRAVAPAPERTFKVLDRYGFRPETVFDIGVGFGTYWLYHAYPEAFYYLVDPTPESLPHMQKIARRLQGEILNLALGDRDGDALLEVRSDIQGSTLFEECGPRGVLRRETIPLRRFDTAIGTFARPALCKIDVQGAEMMVLKGMGARISEIDVFIVETSMIATVKNGPELHELVHFMKEHGLVVFDVIGLKRRPLDGAAAQVDMVFVAERSTMRADRRWNGPGSDEPATR